MVNCIRHPCVANKVCLIPPLVLPGRWIQNGSNFEWCLVLFLALLIFFRISNLASTQGFPISRVSLLEQQEVVPDPPEEPAPQGPHPEGNSDGSEPDDDPPAPSDSSESEEDKTTPIRIATWNIQSGRNGRLEQALRAMGQMNIDLGFLTEAKLTDGIHTRYSFGYRVVATEARSGSQGGVALFYRDSRLWSIESEVKHGPNVISCWLVTGFRRIPLVGAYVPPADLETLDFINQALDRFPNGAKPILLGDLNAELAHPRDARESEVATVAANHGLECMLSHYRQTSGHGHCQTWWQYRNGELVSSHVDYILAEDRRMFSKVSIRSPQSFTSDHRLVLGILPSSPLSENKAYLNGRKRFPLKAPTVGPLTKADSLFQRLKGFMEDEPREERRARSWISAATWILVDQKAALRRLAAPSQAALRSLTRRIQVALKGRPPSARS